MYCKFTHINIPELSSEEFTDEIVAIEQAQPEMQENTEELTGQMLQVESEDPPT
jgi:hypothetical protein